MLTKLYIILYIWGTPVQWESKFETPGGESGSRIGADSAKVPLDNNGRMTWELMNSIERYHLLPSNHQVEYICLSNLI